MNIYTRILDLCKTTGDTMRSLSNHSGVSESVLSRLKTGQREISKKNLILLANYFCVNEEWLATGIGDREASGLVKDTIIHDERLHERILRLCQHLFGESDGSDDSQSTSLVVNAPATAVALSTGLDPGRIWQILYDKKFPYYSEVMAFVRMVPDVNANWLFCGKGEMFISQTPDINVDRINCLIQDIKDLYYRIDAKIQILYERIEQLESR